MKIVELQEKTEKELETVLAETAKALRAARFKVAFKQLKNVRAMRDHKKTIARILTVIRGRKQV